MAQLDWITAERVIIFVFLTLGISELAWGFVRPTDDVFFGVARNIWLGLGFLLLAILYWHERRSEQDHADE